MSAPTSNAPCRVTLRDVVIVFPKLFQAEKFKPEDRDAFYSASFLLDRNHPDLKDLADKIRLAATIKWKDKAQDYLDIAKAKDKLPVHDGALKASKPYGAAYKGKLYVSARNNERTGARPSVFDNIIDPATGKARAITMMSDPRAPYSGMRVTVKLDLFGYAQGGGEGVGASIAGVQYFADGERLSGGSVASADDFDAIPQENAPATGATPTAGGAADLF